MSTMTVCNPWLVLVLTDASEGKADADSPDSEEEEEGEEMIEDEDWLMDSGDSALPTEVGGCRARRRWGSRLRK